MSRGRISRMGLVAIVSAAALAAAAAFAAPARAWTAQYGGCAGSVQVPTTNGYWGSIFEFPARNAYRSPCYAAYAQVISIRYRLWGFNLQTRQWVYYTEFNWTSAPVAPGYKTTFPSWMTGSTYANISADVLVQWRLTNGTLIDSVYLNYNSISDYACQAGTSCRVYSDPVMGAYLHFG